MDDSFKKRGRVNLPATCSVPHNGIDSNHVTSEAPLADAEFMEEKFARIMMIHLINQRPWEADKMLEEAKLHLKKHARNPESEVTELLPAVVVDRLHSAGIFNVRDCIDNLSKVKSLTKTQHRQVTAVCYAQTLGSKGAGQ